LLLILYQGINCIIIFKRYKKEQLEAMEAEKEQLAAERRQSLEMMRELEALKAQLAQQTSKDPDNKETK
jgi:Tfp pilus assembly protein PilO